MTRAVMLILLLCLTAIVASSPPMAAEGLADRQLPPDHELIRSWQDMRFGMFIHWGPVSLKGTEIGWSRGRQVPKDQYDRLYLEFNPIKFDADQWVQVAKDAGMKYLVITSRCRYARPL